MSGAAKPPPKGRAQPKPAPAPQATSSPRPKPAAPRPVEELDEDMQHLLRTLAWTQPDPEERAEALADLRPWLARQSRPLDFWRSCAMHLLEAANTGPLIISVAELTPPELRDGLFRPVFARIVDLLVTAERPDELAQHLDARACAGLAALLPPDAIAQLCQLAHTRRLDTLLVVCQRSLMPAMVARAYADSYRRHYHALNDAFHCAGRARSAIAPRPRLLESFDRLEPDRTREFLAYQGDKGRVVVALMRLYRLDQTLTEAQVRARIEEDLRRREREGRAGMLRRALRWVSLLGVRALA